MTVWIPVRCPHCNSDNVVKSGKSASGKQRYRCRNDECSAASFILNHAYPGRTKEVQDKIVEMSLNGSGVRDIARVLNVTPKTVIKVLKKKEPHLQQVNQKVIEQLEPENIEVDIVCMEQQEGENIEKAELDEMWSFVFSKANQRWLWHAIDHNTGKVLAYVFGRRKDEVFLELKKLLEPFGIKHFYTDGFGAYQRHLPEENHTISKKYTRKIEQKHTNLRTRIKRLARKTICFSKSIEMHDIVIGLFINRYEFGLEI